MSPASRLFLLLLAACGDRTRDPAPAPAVVLIVIDTLRADHVGFAGYERPTTPRLDALAARGTVFERAIATASWTRPSMASLLTGRFPREVGVYEERFDRLPDDVVTLPERLDAAGWTTLGVTANPNVNRVFGFDQGFDAYEESGIVFRFMERGPHQSRFGRGRDLLGAAHVTDVALDLVDTHAAGGPLFLLAHYVDPHYPYAPPADHLAAVGGGEDRVSRYDGEVRYADAEVGRLLDGLHARGLLDGALVVVTSDHGEGLEDHKPLPLAHSHGHTVYDSVLRVPLVVAGPGVPAGRVAEVVSLIDVAPTILDHAGLPAALPGRSLAPVWESGRGEADRVVYAESDWRYADKIAARSAGHLLVRNLDAARFQADGTHEQAELRRAEARMLRAARPEELHADGADAHPRRQSDAPDARAALSASLDAWVANTPRRPAENRDPADVIVLGDGTVVPDPFVSGDAVVDPATAARLQALGYLDE